MHLLHLALFSAILSPCVASAEFSPKSRSINATAETLPQGRGEIGFASLSLGATDDLMVTIPTLPLLLGALSVGARYRIAPSPSLRISPEVGLTFVAGGIYAQGALGFGLNLGSQLRHAITIKANLTPIGELEFDGFGEGDNTIGENNKDTDDTTYHISAMVNYDYYTADGNLFFAGLLGIAPYLGYTWAWQHFHAGVGLFTIFPYAYFYWRF